MSPGVRSYDVFDTSVTRLVGEPTSLFLLQGRMLVLDGTWPGAPSDYADARVVAEARARTNVLSQEVSLEDIFRELAFAHAVDEPRWRRWAEIELELERALLVVVPSTVEQLRTDRLAGHPVRFVSDTYLPNIDLRRWLVELGVASPGDALWASSAAHVTKSTGDLFTAMLRTEPFDVATALHIGDNVHSDVSGAARHGIPSRHSAECALTDEERAMEGFSVGTTGMSSLLAGASRASRLSLPATASRRAARDLALQVAGPVLSAWILWIFERAAALGLRRLFFVARDGEVLLRMARPLAERLGLEFDMQYVYANRQVVNLAGLDWRDAPTASWIVEGAHAATLAEVLSRVELSVDDLPRGLRDSVPGSGRLGPGGAERAASLFQDEAVRALVAERAAKAKARAKAYFQHVGLMDDVPGALIDVGWKGRVFAALRRVIGPPAAFRQTALYFGLFERPADVPAAAQHAFMFDACGNGHRGVGRDIPVLPNLVEIFTQATHGQVLSVGTEQNHFQPSLASDGNDVGPHWDVEWFQRCLTHYAQSLAVDPRWTDLRADLRPVCDRLLRGLALRPSVEQASCLGGFRYVDGPTGPGDPFAEPDTWQDVVTTLLGAPAAGSNVSWPAGSLALTPTAVRTALKAARRMRRLVAATA